MALITIYIPKHVWPTLVVKCDSFSSSWKRPRVQGLSSPRSSRSNSSRNWWVITDLEAAGASSFLGCKHLWASHCFGMPLWLWRTQALVLFAPSFIGLYGADHCNPAEVRSVRVEDYHDTTHCHFKSHHLHHHLLPPHCLILHHSHHHNIDKPQSLLISSICRGQTTLLDPNSPHPPHHPLASPHPDDSQYFCHPSSQVNADQEDGVGVGLGSSASNRFATVGAA